MEFIPGRMKLIQLQMTLLHALESHTLSQRQQNGELPCVQITGYVSVCVQVWLILTVTVWVHDSCTHTEHMISKYTRICAHRHWRRGVLNRHRCNRDEWVFMSGIMLVCHSHGEVCLWRPGSRRLVLMVYVCLRFPENMPTHAPHFRGVWFHAPAAALHLTRFCWLSCYHLTLRNLHFHFNDCHLEGSLFILT